MNLNISKIFLVLFIVSAIVAVFFANKSYNKEIVSAQNKRLAITRNIEFKGSIINSKVYEYAGKSYYMICIKLDYSNIKNFYVFNDVCALKIKNGVATMSAGVYLSGLGPAKYIEVNINHSNKIVARENDGTINTWDLVIDRSGLTKQDLDFCN